MERQFLFDKDMLSKSLVVRSSDRRQEAPSVEQQGAHRAPWHGLAWLTVTRRRARAAPARHLATGQLRRGKFAATTSHNARGDTAASSGLPTYSASVYTRVDARATQAARQAGGSCCCVCAMHAGVHSPAWVVLLVFRFSFLPRSLSSLCYRGM